MCPSSGSSFRRLRPARCATPSLTHPASADSRLAPLSLRGFAARRIISQYGCAEKFAPVDPRAPATRAIVLARTRESDRPCPRALVRPHSRTRAGLRGRGGGPALRGLVCPATGLRRRRRPCGPPAACAARCGPPAACHGTRKRGPGVCRGPALLHLPVAYVAATSAAAAATCAGLAAAACNAASVAAIAVCTGVPVVAP